MLCFENVVAKRIVLEDNVINSKAVLKDAPRQVMVYSLDRDTPCQTLEKVEKDELNAIAERVRALGIECSVA